jgi:hypothetical protein
MHKTNTILNEYISVYDVHSSCDNIDQKRPTFLQINYKEEMKCILLFIITFIIFLNKTFCLCITLKYLFDNQNNYQPYSNIYLSYVFNLIKEKNLKSYNNLSTKENLMREILSTTIRLDIIVDILVLTFYLNK